jgi:hypothetical protein
MNESSLSFESFLDNNTESQALLLSAETSKPSLSLANQDDRTNTRNSE